MFDIKQSCLISRQSLDIKQRTRIISISVIQFQLTECKNYKMKHLKK